DQVRELGLPPQMKAKAGSSRRKGFTQQYGEDVFELESVPPQELQRLLREAIDSGLDVRAFNRNWPPRKKTPPNWLAYGTRSTTYSAMSRPKPSRPATKKCERQRNDGCPDGCGQPGSPLNSGPQHGCLHGIATEAIREVQSGDLTTHVYPGFGRSKPRAETLTPSRERVHARDEREGFTVTFALRSQTAFSPTRGVSPAPGW